MVWGLNETSKYMALTIKSILTTIKGHQWTPSPILWYPIGRSVLHLLDSLNYLTLLHSLPLQWHLPFLMASSIIPFESLLLQSSLEFHYCTAISSVSSKGTKCRDLRKLWKELLFFRSFSGYLFFFFLTHSVSRFPTKVTRQSDLHIFTNLNYSDFSIEDLCASYDLQFN